MSQTPQAPNGKRLETRELVKVYRQRGEARRVVDEVSITLRKGEIVGLLGPNGAGKTTTFNMVVGLVRPTGGRVFLNGEEITGIPMHIRAQKGLAYLAQDTSIFRRFTVEENLLAIIETLPHLSRAEQRAHLDELLEEYNIGYIRKNRATDISGGERRRVEIARALVRTPDFILLDEPFSGVDPIAVGELQKLIHRLRDQGIGILITDHSVRETLEVTDRAYLIHDGRVIIEGGAEELINDPEARKVYLGEKFYMQLPNGERRSAAKTEDRESQ
ncbi:LPS export ABC transporter ATP-binding protein [Candidatus Sumerlaeota bacterium]|nr:LPS export ABC transporter ATP-binding protein [Candidatus Sumerlaeota bacterium]